MRDGALYRLRRYDPITMNRNDPRLLFLLGGGASLALVGVGIALAESMRLAACPLCIWQRILYMVIAILSGIGALTAGKPSGRLVAFLIAIAAVAGAGIAGYQTWLQRVSPATPCGGAEPWWEAFIRWAGEQAPLLFKASGLCSDPAWTFLGLSIAEWSLSCFLGLLVLALRIAFGAYRPQST